MRASVLAVAAMALLLIPGADAQAQIFGHPKPRQQNPQAQQIDCAKMAQMPNSPMSEASCEQMMQMRQAYESSSAAGARPEPFSATGSAPFFE